MRHGLRVAIWLCVAAVMIATCGATTTGAQHGARAEPVVRSGSSCVSYYPIPSPCLFGVYDSWGTVSSSYWSESSLLGFEAPVGDFDFMVCASCQRHVKLPGHSWYTYLGAYYVSGSGYIMKFLDPWGHHFSLLHLFRVGLRGSLSIAPPSLLATAHRDTLSGDGVTALRAAQAPPLPTSGARRVRGGTYVGWSGWPSSYLYSNYSCGDFESCRHDAHLCLVTSAGSRSWFFWVAAGHDRPKRTFPRAKWGRYAARDARGHLIWAASWTYRHHRTDLYPYRGGERYYPPTKGRTVGYTRYNFSHHRALLCWQRYGTCRVVRR